MIMKGGLFGFSIGWFGLGFFLLMWFFWEELSGFFLILTHLLNGKKGAFIQQTTDKGFTSAAVSNVCKTVPELL